MSAEQVQPASAARDYRDEAERTGPELGDLKRAQKAPNQTVRNLKRFLIGNRLNLLGCCLVAIFLVLSLVGQYIGPYDPYAKGDIINSKLIGPSSSHIMGTDEQGRDVFSRVLAG